jgi:hypothetical protein
MGYYPPMIFTLLAKVIGTSVGLTAAVLYPEHPVWVAALIGIPPIWLEVFATLVTGKEPSLETRPGWRRADALVDATSFVLVPAFWLASQFAQPLLWTGIGFFVCCGLFRLERFLRRGLVEGQHFEGLPVTYTGYVWFACTYALTRGWVTLPALALCTLAVLMVWTRFKVRRTQTRNDSPRNH